MLTKRSTIILLFALCALVISACSPLGGGDSDSPDDEALPAPVNTAPLTVPPDVPSVTQAADWNCGAAKERVLTVVNRLDEWSEAILASSLDPNNEDSDFVVDAFLRELLVEAGTPLTAQDQIVFNAACELYGQHDAAVELWNSGVGNNRGDACDVWGPAKASADETLLSIDMASLNPLVARFWTAATGDVSEGHGRCIAERAN